jgi:RnfABCDGE-type electron transport complex B subunit
MIDVLILLCLMGVIAMSLYLARRHWPNSEAALVEEINLLLPQTQCAQCGYPGCLPYARAVADKSAPLDRCLPGGVVTHTALVQLLPSHEHGKAPVQPAPVVALIDEDRCIGCFRCIPVCPVDAIVGARNFVHTVLHQDCTGCGLCLPECPVDCISLLPLAR